jgi:hypothetical protein
LNRLAQFFPAPTRKPETARPEPAKGFDHFAIGLINRFKLKRPWTPRNSEDAPTAVRYKDITWHSRRELSGVADALRWVKDFNEKRIDSNDIETDCQWALLAWKDGGYERLRFDVARQIAPFTYRTHRMLPQPNFRPSSVLDVPAATWTDTSGLSLKDQYATVEEAVQAAAKANRGWRPNGKRKSLGLPMWTVVLAFENEEVDEHGAISCAGGLGSLVTTTSTRFHVVDQSWPMSPETLAIVKGGVV